MNLLHVRLLGRQSFGCINVDAGLRCLPTLPGELQRWRLFCGIPSPCGKSDMQAMGGSPACLAVHNPKERPARGAHGLRLAVLYTQRTLRLLTCRSWGGIL